MLGSLAPLRAANVPNLEPSLQPQFCSLNTFSCHCSSADTTQSPTLDHHFPYVERSHPSITCHSNLGLPSWARRPLGQLMRWKYGTAAIPLPSCSCLEKNITPSTPGLTSVRHSTVSQLASRCLQLGRVARCFRKAGKGCSCRDVVSGSRKGYALLDFSLVTHCTPTV